MDVQAKTHRVQRNFAIYAALIFLGMAWNMVDGGVQDYKDFLRGIIRFGMIVYLAYYLTSYRKTLWWIAVFLAAIFTVMGLGGLVYVVSIGKDFAVANPALVLTLIPATILMIDSLVILLKREVKAAFVH